MASRGYVCLLLVLLAAGTTTKALEEEAENKLTELTPQNKTEDGGRFFFATTSSSSTNPNVTITLGTGDVLFAVLAVALSVAAGVLIAGILLGDKVDTSGYSAPSTYESDHHTAESSYAVLRSLETAALTHE